MKDEVKAIGQRDGNDNKITVEPENGIDIPRLDQWLREYVAEAKIHSDMVVMVAKVAGDSVEHLTISERCANAKAEYHHHTDSSVEISDGLL